MLTCRGASGAMGARGRLDSTAMSASYYGGGERSNNAYLLFYERADGSWTIKVVDFGLARAPSVGAQDATTEWMSVLVTSSNQAVAGTLPFM